MYIDNTDLSLHTPFALDSSYFYRNVLVLLLLGRVVDRDCCILLILSIQQDYFLTVKVLVYV